jgi:hypothetical protein
MRDERSEDTPTVDLVGPLKPKAAPDAKTPAIVEKAAEPLSPAPSAPAFLDDDDLVPAVRSFAIQQPSVPPPLPKRSLAPAPERAKGQPPAAPRPLPLPAGEERTVEVARPTEAELRARATTYRPPPPEPAWRRGIVWMLTSAVVGGSAMFVVMRMREDHPDAAPKATVAVAAPVAPPQTAPSTSGDTVKLPVAMGSAYPEGHPPVAASAADPAVQSSVASAAVVPVPPEPATSLPPTAGPRGASSGDISRAPGRPGDTPKPPGAVVPSSGAPAELLASAAQARQQGKLPRAKTIYRGILARSPDDVEALTGLADVARAEGKGSDARAFYQHALIVNPGHGPAILGLADTLWELDDKDGARARYRELLKRAPPSSYPARVESRAAL